MPATPSTQSGGATRAPIMRRESSQTSHSSKHGVHSPGSGEVPLHRPVKPARHAKVVLPRNHSSARNLQKLQRQAQQQQAQALAPAYAQGVTFEDAKGRTVRQRSHEGDTEIRLPGSLDESQAVAPPMRRNLTAYQLPRTNSHSKLKKNLSHGHLTRLGGSSKNLAALNSTKGPPSPGLKGRKKRPKSADFGSIEKDLHEQEVELAQQRQEEELAKRGGGKKVGFAVGSSGDDGEEHVPEMEGSGMQEDDWTDQSASASPYSTRQNTANNSRRASMNFEKPADKAPAEQSNGQVHRLQNGTAGLGSPLKQHQEKDAQAQDAEEQEAEASDEAPSPRSLPHVRKRDGAEEETESAQTTPLAPQPPPPKVPLTANKDARSPFTQRLLSRGSMNSHSPAPALVSNVNAMVEAHSANSTPAPSLRSSKSNLDESTSTANDNDNSVPSDPENSEELVSRFIPSASHPSTNSGTTTAVSTPKTGDFHTPESRGHNATATPAQARSTPGISTPTSTEAGHDHEQDQNADDAEGEQSNPIIPPPSSGINTPSLVLGRSRTELRMLTEKAMADREDAARAHPPLPPHVYDRRNLSLKSWLRGHGNSAYGYGGAGAGVAGEELFQGRFKAADTELKVVQRFRDPVGESLERLRRQRKYSGAGLLAIPGQGGPQRVDATGGARMPTSKSAVQLSKQGQSEKTNASKLSSSASPPPGTASSMTASPAASMRSAPAKSAITNSKSATQLRREPSRRGKVTFSQPDEGQDEEDAGAQSRQVSGGGEGKGHVGAEAIARRMWMAGGRSVSAQSA